MSNWNPNDDFPAIADATEPVTYVNADEDSTAVAAALRGRVTRRQAEQSGGRFTVADVVWHLPQSELASPPKPGERIIDAVTAGWAIVTVEQDTADSRWRCTCRQLLFAALATDNVDWLQASWAKNEHGALDLSLSLQQEDIPAQIEFADAEQEVKHGARTIRRAATISLESELALQPGDQLQDAATGDLYDVLGFSSPSPGEPFVVEASGTSG